MIESQLLGRKVLLTVMTDSLTDPVAPPLGFPQGAGPLTLLAQLFIRNRHGKIDHCSHQSLCYARLIRLALNRGLVLHPHEMFSSPYRLVARFTANLSHSSLKRVIVPKDRTRHNRFLPRPDLHIFANCAIKEEFFR